MVGFALSLLYENGKLILLLFGRNTTRGLLYDGHGVWDGGPATLVLIFFLSFLLYRQDRI